MNVVVQKYGGSSLANAERVRAVANRVAQTRVDGSDVVVIVSAMGDATDDLLQLAKSVTQEASDREMDLLLSTGEMVSCALMSMALRSLGVAAVALTGWQAGIRTDSKHSRASIIDVDSQRVLAELRQGNVVIVAGFQGTTDQLDITTLGRGGSDTTAVALAASLGAQVCEIYTDVDGVYTADPRVVTDARKLDAISYEEMLEMATVGARVMHPRAVELGEVYGIPIIVRSSFNHNPGTVICGGQDMERRNRVRGIAHQNDVAKLTVSGVPDTPGVAYKVFAPLAEAGISVDVIVQNVSVNGVTDLSFTLPKDEIAKAIKVLQPVVDAVGAAGLIPDSKFAKVSIVGTGIQNSPGYAAKMFGTLSNSGVNIEMISTSDIRITCLIDADDVERAVRALHEAFELEKADA